MSLDRVPEIVLKDGSLVFTVEVVGAAPGAQVEISGTATQANGAMATFNDIQSPPPPAEPGGGSALTVTTSSPGDLVAGEVITVVVRATTTWPTVLSGDPGDPRLSGDPGIKAVWKAKPES